MVVPPPVEPSGFFFLGAETAPNHAGDRYGQNDEENGAGPDAGTGCMILDLS